MLKVFRETGNGILRERALPAQDPLPVWNEAKQKLIAGDIEGALVHFSGASANQYREAWQSIGNSILAQMLSEIGNITPVFIRADTASIVGGNCSLHR